MALAVELSGCASPLSQEREALDYYAQAYEGDVETRGLLIDDDPELQTYLDSVGAAIAAQAPGGPIQLRIAVRRSPAMGAMVLSNGAVYLDAGLLARVADESQLALVIGYCLYWIAPDRLASTYSETRSKRTAARVWRALGPIATLPASSIEKSLDQDVRHRVDEADAAAMEWLARAGFRSEAAPELFTALGAPTDPDSWKTRYQERREHCASLVQSGAVPANPAGRNDVAALRAALSRVSLESVRLEVAGGEYARALRDTELVRQRYGDNAPLHYLQGKSELLIQSFDRSEGHMRRALVLDPAYRPAQRGLGEVLLAKGDSTGAAAIFTDYLRADPHAPDAGIALALLRKTEGRDPNQKLSALKRIAILQVEPALPLIQYLTDADFFNELRAGAAEVQDTAHKLLRLRGFDPKLLELDGTIFDTRPELRFQLTQAQQTGEDALRRLRTADRTGAQTAFRGSLDEIHQLAALVGADAVLFTRLEIGGPHGLLVKDRMFTVATCLVDANTGELIYVDSSDGGRYPWAYSEMAELALAKLKR